MRPVLGQRHDPRLDDHRSRGFTATGLDVTTSGHVSIQNSTFEATGAMRLTGQGGASITVRGNELRANNLITYQANNPDVPVMLELSGTTTGARVVQGNRIGAGILRIGGMAGRSAASRRAKATS